MVMNYGRIHTALVNQCLIEGSKLVGVTLFKLTTGVGRSLDREHKIKFGILGGSDIIGILAPTGRWFCAEVKTGKAQPRKQQNYFRAAIEAYGGYYCVVRSVDDLIANIHNARKRND
jgi:hypothetical protein